ncbi:uncharacterized protein PV09_09594 [Verruconis gallopava]|uniref:Endo-1,5-alpha-L-arabinanase A n=1 Tax=Verruconis gallopava TaxID=253628 RepID=A0A0D2AI75_9PEZI|nr:uncharacterized protein PV09_09594 [Verruconis gallopava]KIV98618.1 hypothetical protein PV09_09594 [Verruconis gallopava]
MNYRILQLVLAVLLVRFCQSLNLTALPALANFSDPSLVYDSSSSNWYAFSTNEGGKNVPVAWSSDFIQWNRSPNDSLPSSSLPAWAKANGPVWAPDVSYNGSHFIMYYTATLSDYPAHHCIGAAVSPNATGPYSPLGKDPLICPSPTGQGNAYSPVIESNGTGGAIDAFGYMDSSQQRYIVYKIDGNSLNSNTGSDGVCGNNGTDTIPTPIMIVAVANDGITPTGTGTPVQILGLDETDPEIIEAPSIMRLSNGTYVLFYSSGCFLTPEYTVKFAVAPSIIANYTKKGSFLVTGDNGLDAPGGLSVAADGKHLVYHANFQGSRALYSGLIDS